MNFGVLVENRCIFSGLARIFFISNCSLKNASKSEAKKTHDMYAQLIHLSHFAKMWVFYMVYFSLAEKSL